MPWSPTVIGGVSTVVRNLAAQWQAVGQPCGVLVDDWSVRSPQLRSGEWHHRLAVLEGAGPLPAARQFRSMLAAGGPLLRFAALLRTLKCEAINFHYPGILPLGVALLKRSGLWNGRLVISFHGTDIPHASDRDHWTWRLMLSQADSLTAVSNALARQLAESMAIQQERITVIHNGVDTNLFCPAVPLNPGPACDPVQRVITSVGHYVGRKNHTRLIRAFASLASEDRSLKLVIVGMRGPELPALEALAKTLGLVDRVELLVDQSASAVANLLRQSELVVQPSIEEPFGLAVVEAAATGVPVAVSAVGGHLEIIRHGITGWTFDPLDEADIQRAMVEALSHPIESRARAARLLCDVREQFSWQKCAAAYLSELVPPG